MSIEQTVETPEVETQEVIEAGADTADEGATEAEVSDDASDDDVSKTPDDELKTVRKALDKRNRYINNQRNKIRALEAEMSKLKEGFGKGGPEAPQLEKFDSVLDYMKADQTHTLEQKLAEQAHNAKVAQLEQQQQAAFAQREQEVATQVQELLTSNPDFAKTIQANVNVIDAMPPHVERLMMEIDDAPAATYALVKEGRLQDLYYMPPHIAAAHLVQAEIRGQQLLQQAAPKAQAKPAPQPIGSIKGGSGKSTSKSPEDMSPDQLMKWLKS